jgi:hypothetical protein
MAILDPRYTHGELGLRHYAAQHPRLKQDLTGPEPPVCLRPGGQHHWKQVGPNKVTCQFCGSGGEIGTIRKPEAPKPVNVKTERLQKIQKYQCEVCHYWTLKAPPPSYEICRVCFWEDACDTENISDISPCNGISVIAAQQNYAFYRACEEKFQTNTRPPTPEEKCGAV